MNRRLVDLVRGAATYGAELLASANGDLRATLLLNEYRDRRRHYARRSPRVGVALLRCTRVTRTKDRLAARGISVQEREPGQVHTLAFFPLLSWHSQLLRPLQALGPLSLLDSLSSGLDYAALSGASRP